MQGEPSLAGPVAQHFGPASPPPNHNALIRQFLNGAVDRHPGTTELLCQLHLARHQGACRPLPGAQPGQQCLLDLAVASPHVVSRCRV